MAGGVSWAGEDRDAAYRLPDVLSIARERNPTVAAFQANVDAARGALTAARTFPNPEFDVELGRARPADVPGAEYEREHRWAVSQRLEWPGTRRDRRGAAEARVGAAQGDLEEFGLELSARVTETFYQLLSAQRRLAVVAQDVGTAERLVTSAALRVESGEAPELELIRARVEFLNVTKEARRARNRLLSTKATLNGLLGGALGMDFSLIGEPPRVDAVYELPALIERALATHPLIARQREVLQTAKYSLAAQRSARIPDLTLSGSSSQEIDKRSSAIGIVLSVPLFDQRRGEIASARAERDRARAALVETRVDLTRQITHAYEDYRTAVDQLKAFEEGLLRQADEALRIAQLSYEQGELDLLDLLDAQRVRRATQLDYTDAQLELSTALSRLEHVTGGLP